MAKRDYEDVVLEVKKSRIKPPPMFKVILLNDDFTPMEFVVVVLQTFFSKSQEQAAKIMLKVHMNGVGVCGVYPSDVARTKVKQVVTFARNHQHPLKCVMEEET
jgi:ATP-dependent Clp protease adaptor protein ClpS